MVVVVVGRLISQMAVGLVLYLLRVALLHL
jgi:hypothetical protein